MPIGSIRRRLGGVIVRHDDQPGKGRTALGPVGGASRWQQINVPPERIEQAGSEPSNWLTYSGSYRSWRYSELDEITTRNVSGLTLAWSLRFRTGDPIEASPIVVDGIMFLTVPVGEVLAVDAGTGDVVWRYNRSVPNDVSVCCGRVNRGVAVLNDRVFVGTLDGFLVALEAATGRVVWQTQVADYREGYSITAAPLAARNKVIVGVAGGEYGIRGFLDGYDPTTGERAWRFHTIPEPGQLGADTWGGESWKTGGGPTWLTGSFDPTLGLLYWGVGNPSPDYNGDSRPGDNLFTASVVALNVDDGTLAWHFQFTPHDLHDWDANQIPVLVDHEVEGQPRQLMLWANRNGFYYVLDRRTGEFLHASSFVKQNWARSIDPNGRPILIPGMAPSERGTLTWPGQFGGTNWWSPSYSPKTDLVYVPFVEEPKVFFKGDEPDQNQPRRGQKILGGKVKSTGAPYQTGVRALHPVTGTVAWENLTGVRRGSGWTGGTLASAGNLVFFGDGSDFVAFDARDGRELWRADLGGFINASPVSFSVGGHQRVAVPAGNTLFVFRPFEPPR